MDKERRFPLVLNSFWLKIAALLTMTIDHIGYAMMMFNMNYSLALVFRCIGRLALPLFCFMIAEGAIHTKNFNRYALRLGIMASAVSLIILGSEAIPFFKNNGLSMRDEGIIFLDLLFGALTIYFLRQKKWYLKLLALLPLAYGVASFIATCFESCHCYGEILWFPYFMRTQYGWYGILMILGFYFAHFVANWVIRLASEVSHIPYDAYEGTNYQRNTLNIVSTLIMVAITALYCLMGYLLPPQFVYFGYDIQFYAVISGVFILLYSGLRGYNKAWFQYGSYLYYLVHLPVVYLLVYLLALI